MTVPITPGPFSFLAEFGRAGGAAFAAGEQARQQRQDEAYRAASLLLKLSEMRKDPKILATPYAMKIYEELGIPAPSTEPTSDELAEGIKRKALTAPPEGAAAPIFPGGPAPFPGLITGTMMQPQFTPEQRALAGLPAQSTVLRERAAPKIVAAEVAEAEARVPQAQLSRTTAEAALPEAATTTLAGQQAAQDKQFNDLADMIVRDLFIKGGRKALPTAADAYATGRRNVRVSVFGDKITPEHYGRAIDRLRAELEEERTRRAAAQARTANMTDDLARVYLGNIKILEDQLAGLARAEGITDRDALNYDLWISTRAQGKKVAPLIEASAQRFARYKMRADRVRSQLNEMQRKLNASQGIVDIIPTDEPGGVPGLEGRSITDEEVNARAAYAKSNRLTEDQIRQGVEAGHFSAADAEAIIQAYRRMRTHSRPQ